MLLGLACYQLFLSRCRYRPLLFGSSLAALCLGFLPLFLVLHWNRVLGIPDVYFLCVDSALLSGVGEVMQIPLMCLGLSRHCHVFLELVALPLLCFVADLNHHHLSLAPAWFELSFFFFCCCDLFASCHFCLFVNQVRSVAIRASKPLFMQLLPGLSATLLSSLSISLTFFFLGFSQYIQFWTFPFTTVWRVVSTSVEDY